MHITEFLDRTKSEFEQYRRSASVADVLLDKTVFSVYLKNKLTDAGYTFVKYVPESMERWEQVTEWLNQTSGKGHYVRVDKNGIWFERDGDATAFRIWV